jgi:hypothetical protein
MLYHISLLAKGCAPSRTAGKTVLVFVKKSGNPAARLKK